MVELRRCQVYGQLQTEGSDAKLIRRGDTMLNIRVFVICVAGILLLITSIRGQNEADFGLGHQHSFVYVTNQGSFGEGNTVSVIATASNTVVDTITVGQGPNFVTASPNGRFAYVSNSRSDTVSVVDTATNTVVSTITVGNGPGSIAFTPHGNLAYVPNGDSDSVSVINTATNQVVATIDGISIPAEIAITPDGESAYVTNLWTNGNPANGNAVGSVSVIDIDRNM